MLEFLVSSSFTLGIIFFFVVIFNIKQVNEYQRGILFTLGKFTRVVGSGWTFIWPIFQSMRKVDTRTKTVDLKEQQCMTGDNVPVEIGAVLFFRITDPAKAILEVENFLWAVSQLAETTMRTVVGEVVLQELLTNRDDIARRIETIIAPKADAWGVTIEAVELKDMVLPQDMQRTMAKQAEAEREKISVITKAEGELIASTNLQKAAANMSKTPGALHLRTLSTLNDLSSDQSNTIIFAVPVEILRAFDNIGSGDKLIEKIAKLLKK